MINITDTTSPIGLISVSRMEIMSNDCIVYILVLALSLTRAEQRAEAQESTVTKLRVVDFGESSGIETEPEQADVQRKRDSGYSYNKPSRISSYPRLRLQANQPRDEIASRKPGQLSRPFTRYGPPNHSSVATAAAAAAAAHGYRGQHHRGKLQHHVDQQQSIGYDVGSAQQEVPSPIRNADFASENAIASQNNEPFGMYTANYLPPQNQKLPASSSVDNFAPQSYSPPIEGQQQLAQLGNQQISDAALFLSQNAQAIQQLYGAPASGQDFAPSHDQLQDPVNQIQTPSAQFGGLESTSPSPAEFPPGALPPYASGTLNPQETLEQIQSLEKDRLIVQLQQALAQAQSSPSVAAAAGRYAQNQASFIPSQEFLTSISQRMKSHVPPGPQSVAFTGGNTAFSQSPFLPGTTLNPLGPPLSYGVPTTTAQTPTTTTVVTAPPPQSAGGDGGSIQVSSSLPAPNQPGPSAAASPVGIPIYGGFVPTLIAGPGFVPTYSGVFATGPLRPAQPSGSSPTHFGIPIPTQPPEKPTSRPPASTTPVSVFPDRPGLPLSPAITPVILPVQPLRPVAAPLHPIVTPLQPPPLPATPVVTSTGVQYSYGVQNALVNPALYKPVRAVYPVYYYSNVAYQPQKAGSVPSYPWSYAPSYAQAKPAQIWK
ncbi:extensin [Harpegnathos saltator]|uniref:extensin n=1 Tax=Harpegnathos saltator TaxID=610380 RepID=UPI000DBEF25D|nr:extensin [Harpegnathos saltator]